MAYEFFFSYARANNDLFLKMFFDELSQAIRDKRGLPAGAAVGFFDQRNIELGEEWDQGIVEALNTSNVLIAVASPGYFKSEYCGKEWELFRQRLVAAGRPKLPPLIKPVVWIPFRIEELPATVTAGQLTCGDPAAIHNQKGLKYLLKNLQAQQIAFNERVDALADEIIAAADEHAVGRMPQVPALSSVPSSFLMTAHAVAGQPPVSSPTGPKHVRFVYVAANPDAFGKARAVDAYMDKGGADWKPYFPDDKTRIHRLVQNLVSSDDLDFTSEEMPFSASLLDDIEDAWSKRQIVILIVDGWSVRWDKKYQALLSQLDGRLDYHWCVLIPRNEKDTDANSLRADIEATLSSTFDRHANLAPNPFFYRDNIGSAADLKNHLRDVLTKLKEEIKKRAPVAMPVPAGPSRTLVSGPSA